MKLLPLDETTMSLTLPTELLQTAQMTEAQMLREIAIMLYHQQRLQLEQAAELTGMAIDDFYQLLVSRNIITPPTDQQLNQTIQQYLIDKEEADKQAAFRQSLLDTGLVKQINRPSYEPITERQLIQVVGKAVSETIIEERR